MALPLEFHETFEQGPKGNFDSETDTGDRLDFPHQRDLGHMMPWRGAHLCWVNPGKSNTDAFLSETVSWASGQVRYGRFKMFVGRDAQFGNDADSVKILMFGSAVGEETRIRLTRNDPLGICLAPAKLATAPLTAFRRTQESRWGMVFD
jgi:hypothetical protein